MEHAQYTESRNKEYDAFGPWIYEIDDEHEVPKLFKDYCSKDTPLLLIKIPRKIERRYSSANMDLYEYLIGAYDTYLHIMKRYGGRVKEKKIYYKNIAAIKDVHALLKGELIIFSDEIITIDYNTVSEEVIRKLISIIITKKTTDSIREYMWESIPVEYAPGKETSLEMLFFNLINKLNNDNPQLLLIAYQPRIYIDSKSELRKRIKSDKRMLSTAAFVSDGKQLIILERETPVKKKEKEDYAYSYLYLPYQSIKGVRIEKLDEQRLYCSLKLTTNGSDFNYIFQRKNKQIWDIYKKFETV